MLSELTNHNCFKLDSRHLLCGPGSDIYSELGCATWTITIIISQQRQDTEKERKRKIKNRKCRNVENRKITLPKRKLPGISLVKNAHSRSSKAKVMWSAMTCDQKIKNEPLSLHWRRLVRHADLQDSVEPTPVHSPLILTRGRINACVWFAVSRVSSDYQHHIKMKHMKINIGLPALWFSTWVCCRGAKIERWDRSVKIDCGFAIRVD